MVRVRDKVRVKVRVRVRVRVRGRGRVRGRVKVRVRGGLLPTTSHSISSTTVNAEGSPSGGLSEDICRHRMGSYSNDAGTLAV